MQKWLKGACLPPRKGDPLKRAPALRTHGCHKCVNNLAKAMGRNGTSGVAVDEKIVAAISYGEFHCGSFELVPKNFRRSDPAVFEFQIPTAVILLNGTSKKKVLKSR